MEDQPLRGVAEDYRTLLADGVVGFRRAGRSAYSGHFQQWEAELLALAEADGLRAGVFFTRLEDVAVDPYLQLLLRDGKPFKVPAIGPYYDQQEAAIWRRPRAESEWGVTLTAARQRARLQDQ